MIDAADDFAPLRRELDAWQALGKRATLWWRDDDAAVPAPSLEKLFALRRASAVPLALAVVPAKASPSLPAAFGDGEVAILQHGYAHANYAPPSAKPCELGVHRPAQIVIGELATGWDTLHKMFGARALPVLVPPWNRIAPAVSAGLPRLGYRALSAFGPRAVAEPVPGLLQVNCHADPIVWREDKRFAGASATLERLRAHLAARREGHADPSEPTGLLTHHRDMDPLCWAFLEELLGRLRTHPAVTFPPLPSLLAAPLLAPR